MIPLFNAVRYVRSSDARLQKFKTCIELEKIECKSLVVLDVPNRWNSTYLMLTNALKFQKAFERLQEEDGYFVTYFLEDECGKGKIGPPTNNDWEKVQSCVDFLKTIYYATLECTTPLYVTSNIYFHKMCSIQLRLTKLGETGDPLIGTTVTSMKKEYEQNQASIDSINKLLIISVALDPRYKLDNVAFCFYKMYGDDEAKQMRKGVKDLLFRLYDFYSALDTSSGIKASNDVQLSSGKDVKKKRYRNIYEEKMEEGFLKYLEEHGN
ncbi:hypothetical protein ACOSQ2_020765 [Xanthoceras sorbifolium]